MIIANRALVPRAPDFMPHFHDPAYEAVAYGRKLFRPDEAFQNSPALPKLALIIDRVNQFRKRARPYLATLDYAQLSFNVRMELTEHISEQEAFFYVGVLNEIAALHGGPSFDAVRAIVELTRSEFSRRPNLPAVQGQLEGVISWLVGGGSAQRAAADLEDVRDKMVGMEMDGYHYYYRVMGHYYTESEEYRFYGEAFRYLASKQSVKTSSANMMT